MSQKTTPKQSRPRRTEAFKNEALELARRLGVAKAAKELGVYESQIYQWRKTAQAQDNQSLREDELIAENARLKKELALHKEELASAKKKRRCTLRATWREVHLYQRQ